MLPRDHLTAEGKTPNTIRAYSRDLRLFARWFETTNGKSLTPQGITPIDLRQYRSHLLTVKGRKPATATTLWARWSASDPDSSITLCRYAIGTTPGGTEVVNWTSTGDTEVTRSGLNLLAGQAYCVSVKARNEGGLWSDAGVSDVVVAGSHHS